MSVARHLTLIPVVAVLAIAWPDPARGAAVIVVDTTADEDINRP